MRRACAGTILLVLACATAVAGQTVPEPSRTVMAARLQPGDRLTLDGRLSEEAWRRATPAAQFRQQDPQNSEPATEATEVRVLYDEHRIVLGIVCFDSEPGRLSGNQMQRDQSLTADDRFMVAIDTYSDRRSGYYFEINPSGAMGDGLVLPGNGISVNRSWDGIWDARVQRTSDGWTAEIEIPLRTLNFERDATSWGINFQRTVRRKTEESLWSGWARNQGLTYMAAAGRLEGLEGLTQGLGLDLLPYVLGSSAAAPGRGAPTSRQNVEFGGDIAYSLMPGLRANLSLNTDFAETEVDQRLVNLTRFPLFFPEKRTFFLEGASLFDFSRETGNAIIPFFSRRIGLDESGVPQPIDVGLKLTGQAGRFDIGALQVRTRDRDAVPGENFTVARVRRRFLRQSYVGGIFTSRSEDARQTAGVDVVLSTSEFLRSQVLEVSGFYLTTTKLPGTQGGAAYGARINLPNDPWNIRMSVRQVDDGYDPATGFVDRRGYRLLHPGVRRVIHTEDHPVVRRFSFEADLNFTYDTRGVLETRRPDLQLVRVDLQAGDILEYHILPLYERLPRDFQIFSGVVLPAGGEYSFFRRRAAVQSATKRPVSVNASYEDGDFFSGQRRQLSGTVSVRPHRGWLINAGADYNQVSLAEGRFITRLWTNDVNTQLNPFISLVNRVQYDTITRQLGWQARFRWITRPGSDLFFVYTHNWRDQDTLQTLDRRAALKIVRTLRF
jgi:uncharacterized protein DUF5916/cellulose/xylan binding protein with CBM9 domain